MADEKVFTIPLRREFLKVVKYQRTKKAIIAVRKFIQRHMKVEEVKIGKNLNLLLWSQGRRNPPPRVKVKSVKEDAYALVELPEFPFAVKKQEEKKGLAEKILGKKDEKKQGDKLESLKEMRKEVAPAEKEKAKKEHTHTAIEVPEKMLKSQEKIKENTQKYSKVVPDSGRKQSHEGKP